MPPVIMQVALDGSYGKSDVTPRIMAYGGVFGFEDAWRALIPIWNGILAEFGLEYFRTSEHKSRADFAILRERLVSAVRKCHLHAVGTAADLGLLTTQGEASRKREIFEHVVSQIFAKAPESVNFALICDREQDLAKEVVPWMERLRWEAQRDGKPRVYDRIVALCYVNSRLTLIGQVGDLGAALFREYGEQQARNPTAPVDPILDTLTEGRIVAEQSTRSEFLGGTE